MSDEMLSLDELDMGDIVDIPVETTYENVYISKHRREACVEGLKEVRDSYVQLISLNHAISIFLKTQSDQYLASTTNKVNAYESVESSPIEVNTCKEQLMSKIPRLEREIEEGKRLAAINITQTQIGDFTVEEALYLADVIPTSLGRSDYAVLITGIQNNHMSVTEPLTLAEKISIIDKIKAILYYCDTVCETVNGETPKFNLISDISDEQFLYKTDEEQSARGYSIPIFDMTDKLNQVKEDINYLSKDVNYGDDVPSVYTIKQIEKLEDSYQNKEYLKITLELFFSSKADAPETKVIYRSNTFDNQMHLVGISSVRVKSINNSLAEVAGGFVKPICEELGVETSLEDVQNIIRVPYYIHGVENDGSEYIVISENESPFCIKSLEESKVEGYANYLAFLQEAISKRVSNSNSPVWYSCVTASPTATPNIITKATANTYDESTEVRYTGEELLQIAKSKNAKKYIINYYSTYNGRIVEESIDPLTVQIASNYLDRDTLLIKQSKQLNEGLKFEYNNIITPNRTIIMQAIMQCINRPVNSRCDIDSIFIENKKSIMDVTLPQIYAKMPYDRENIGLLLGSGLTKSTFYTYIKTKKYESDANFKLNLKAVDIIDSLALIYRLRLRGFASQDFSQGTIYKTIKLDKDNIETTAYTPEEFIQEFIKINKEPKCLLDAWGIIPVMGTTITRVSSAYSNILTALVEAYQIYTLLLSSEILEEQVDIGIYQSQNQLENGDDVLNLKYNQSLAPLTKINGYEAIKDLGISEEFYVKYSQYLNRIINNYFITKKPINTNFDGGMIINAYIRAMHDLTHTEKSLNYKLFFSHKGLQEADENCDDIILNAIDLIETTPSVSVDAILAELKIQNNLETEDAERLQELFNQLKSLINLTHIPMVELLKLLVAISENEVLTQFTADSVGKLLYRLGLNSDNESNISFNVAIEGDNYSPNNVKASVEVGKNMYVVRDTTLLSAILGSVKFSSWVKSLTNAKTDEEWQKANSMIYDVVVSKMKSYTTDKVDKLLTTIENKVADYIDKDAIDTALNAYVKLIAPTEIDAAYLLTYVNKIVSDTISQKESLLNIGKIKLETIDLKQVSEIEEKLYQAQRKNDFVTLLAPFLAIDDVLQANEELHQINEEMLQIINSNRDDSVYLDPRTIKKSTALYQKYLQTGNTKYTEEVIMDAVPFELLTLDMPAKYKIAGPYSKRNLIFDHSLVDLNDEAALLEAMNLSYIDLLNQILEQYPDFYLDCPRAIREYIAKQEAEKLR